MDQQVRTLVATARRARSVLNTALADYPERSVEYAVIARRMDELDAALAPFTLDLTVPGGGCSMEG